MNPDTKFQAALSFTSSVLPEVQEFLEKHRVKEIPCFSDDIVHALAGESFSIDVEGQRFGFTKEAYLNFCQLIGIPKAFAEKIPTELLLQNVDEMLHFAKKKVKLYVRDGHTICGVEQNSFLYADPADFLEAARKIGSTTTFREGSISDLGSLFLFEPGNQSPMTPNVENQGDQFSVGMGFQIGYGSGRLRAEPYSLRHVCTNIAIAPSERPKYRLAERIKSQSKYRFYERLIENYNDSMFQEHLREMDERIRKAITSRMTDLRYATVYPAISKVVGEEVALNWLGLTEDRHAEIQTNIRFKRSRKELDSDHAEELSDIDAYSVFNDVTAAAKGYTGDERAALQFAGGLLL